MQQLENMSAEKREQVLNSCTRLKNSPDWAVVVEILNANISHMMNELKSRKFHDLGEVSRIQERIIDYLGFRDTPETQLAALEIFGDPEPINLDPFN